VRRGKVEGLSAHVVVWVSEEGVGLRVRDGLVR